MQVLGWAFRVLAVLVLLGGVGGGLLSATLYKTISAHNTAFAAGVSGFVVGLFLFAIGSALHALHRIDINTERTADALEALVNRRSRS